MAKNTLIDDLFEIFRSICFYLPVWAIFLVAGVPAIFVFFLTAFMVSPLAALQTNGPNLASALPLFTGFLAYGLGLVAGLSGWRARQDRRGLVAQTKSLEDLRMLNWRDFELMVGELYRKRGYDVTEGRGRAPDGGIDLDTRSPDGRRILIQCKHWKSTKIGVKIVRETLGVVHKAKAAGGIVIGTGQFTEEAKRFAQGQPIDLVDGTELLRQLAEIENKAAAEKDPNAIPRVILDPEPDIKQASPNEAFMPPPAKKLCPKCGGEMVERVARRGTNAGQKFYGCGSFPKCRHTINI